MALITCRECGISVSSMAHTCPNCGYPFSAHGKQGQENGVVTIQQTSKPLKLMMLVFVILLVAGICVIAFGFSGNSITAIFVGLVITFIAAVAVFAVKSQIWWQHK